MHIISGDIQLHKRTLEPIKTMIYGLRRYDVDRCAALINPAKLNEKVVVEVFMSHKAKIYLVSHNLTLLCISDFFNLLARPMFSTTWIIS